MATAPKPRSTPEGRAFRRAASAARRAAWPPPKDADEAGFRAMQPYGGDSHPLLVVVRCSTKGCGKALAWVGETDEGPVFWAVITWGAPERREIEKDQIRRMRSEQYPGQMDDLRRNRAAIKAAGGRLQPMFPKAPKRLPHRRDVFDLLDADGDHPDLATRCRTHGFALVQRELLLEKVREAMTLPEAKRPLVLGIHHPRTAQG